MTQATFKAIYQNGVLRPLQPLAEIPENQQLDVTVTVNEKPGGLKDCFGILPDEDAREMAAIIEAEFEKVDLDEWK
jgi:predicted DNA-binding antitoxin AbrB/MazE fold protein